MIEPREFYAAVAKGRSLKDLSWQMLNEPLSTKTMMAEAGGDAAENNFALAVFEQALDWRLGIAAWSLIKACVAERKRYPKPFQIALTRGGKIFAIMANGRMVKLS
jgi:hypothetical protein